MLNAKIHPIAIYLPQFHPIPENDEWWGKGFTEWTNVTKSSPRFEGHYQPHLPADLGFYDLRLEEARLEQEKLAKEHGIYGFCYYHYWFNGKRLLNEPIDRKLKNLKENLPYMLCWANENWTRAWDGNVRNVLIEQNFSQKDDEEHIIFLCENHFKDKRYIKQDGKPIFLVYRPKLFPNIRATLALWRKIAKSYGYEDLYLGYVKSWGVQDDPESMGFDFAIEFHPNMERPSKYSYKNRYINGILSRLNPYRKTKFNDVIWDYEEYVDLQISSSFQKSTFPTVMPGWDNSSRRKTNAFILENSTPEKFGDWISNVLRKYPWKKEETNFFFINAWNEWAEGNHLEPCQKWGNAYLKQIKDKLEEFYRITK